MENKSRNEILLEEKVDQIDDINFDKIYDVDEVAETNIDNFDSEIIINDEEISNKNSKNDDITFSMEIKPNEFLDTFQIGQEAKIKARQKEKTNNKPLIFAFTSIMALLCILFVYNLFVINSLSFAAGEAHATYNYTNNVSEAEENDYITFSNNSKIQIEDYYTESREKELQTNWFDSVLDGLNNLFGGKY